MLRRTDLQQRTCHAQAWGIAETKVKDLSDEKTWTVFTNDLYIYMEHSMPESFRESA